MADTDHTFVTTVADNMRQYTKREVTQAKTARQLMARLGYASSQATIDMLDAGMSHCDVTKQDVRNRVFPHESSGHHGTHQRSFSIFNFRTPKIHFRKFLTISTSQITRQQLMSSSYQLRSTSIITF
jgi:hypothetical protein